MRSIFFHCKNYETKFEEFSTRAAGVVTPEQVAEPEQRAANCLAVLITVEKHDEPETATTAIVKEISKAFLEIKPGSVMIVPFAHLSNNLSPFKVGLETLNLIVEKIKAENIPVNRTHFGSHKTLLLDVFGHPGNVRYREV